MAKEIKKPNFIIQFDEIDYSEEETAFLYARLFQLLGATQIQISENLQKI